MNRTAKKLTSLAASFVMAVSALPSGTYSLAAQMHELPESGRKGAAALTQSCSYSLPVLQRCGGDASSFEPMAAYSPVGAGDVPATEEQDEFPESFDMRNVYGMTSVKSQGTYGSCWAHAAIASAESSLLAEVPYIDLSELHSSYYAYYGYDQLNSPSDDPIEILAEGGNSRIITNLWSQWIGPVNEDRMKYDELSYFGSPADIGRMQNMADYHLRNAVCFDYTKDRSNYDEVNSIVKNFVYNGLAVDISYMSDKIRNWDSDYNTSNSNRKPRFANHAVTIVGWDDTFPAGRFRNFATKDGAWLCKNSWGTDDGDDGYMWISYCDRSLEDFAVFELDDVNEHDKIYQYDSFIPVQTISAYETAAETGPSYMADIFTADERSEISAVGTYIYNAGTDYEITVYKDVRDPSDPSSGVPSAVTKGRCDLTGFFTLDLDEPVTVDKGERFAVSVKLYCEKSPFVIPIESSLYVEDAFGAKYDLVSLTNDREILDYTGRGQSFFSVDGKNWGDVKDEELTYTEAEKKALLNSFIEQLYDGLEEFDTELMERAKEEEKNYRSTFSKGDVKTHLGNVTLKVYADNVGKVKFSHHAGAVPTDEKVSLSRNGETDDILYFSGNDEPKEYVSPIDVQSEVTLSAKADIDGATEYTARSFRPKIAEFNWIGYKTTSYIIMEELRYADRISAHEFSIDIPSGTESLTLCFGTICDVNFDGKHYSGGESTDNIYIPFGTTDFEIELSGEDMIGSRVVLHINRSLVSFDCASAVIDGSRADEIYAPDGKKLSVGDRVLDYEGQELTVYKDGEQLSVKVPKRTNISDFMINYREEILGPFSKDVAGRIKISAGKEDDDMFYSARTRLVSGADIDPSLEGNYYLSIIPGESFRLRVDGGNGMFESRTVRYYIPSAPSEKPDIKHVISDGNGRYTYDGDVVLEVAYEGYMPPMLLDALAEEYGYDTDDFTVLLAESCGLTEEQAEKIAGTDFKAGSSFDRTNGCYLRFKASDSDFASQVLYVPPVSDCECGDVNEDGFIDAVDASLVFRHYSAVSAGNSPVIPDEKLYLADMDKNDVVDAVDASSILKIYAQRSITVKYE